ncbi:MAG: selenide, water dikinase SelD [Proteobacteria bacterium]|nr:selenide, water dikinase SelD [Pseudomonadota bacterium]
MSDIYAMGGEPFLALAVAGFPDDLPLEILGDILRGGADAATEAGVVIAGGHTVTDAEPKYGLSVSGFVHPDRILTKGAVMDGDVLFLTKPLGTGIITTGIKRGIASAEAEAAAVASMRRLNRGASHVLRQLPEIRACTDITGYALAGHASEMALASGIEIRIDTSLLPILIDALDLAGAGCVPGGTGRNRDYLTMADADGVTRVALASTIDERVAALVFDPQTSGGLLFSVAKSHADAVGEAFAVAGEPLWMIGEAFIGHGVHFS